ncbi:MAG: polysaccharide deacetylase family protein [Clostridia bacterium]|nr:polysaccharide deacetylase family protein [Clostridia bacterium]
MKNKKTNRRRPPVKKRKRKSLLRRIWGSPRTTVVLSFLFLLSFSTAVYYHTQVYTIRKMVERNFKNASPPPDVFLPEPEVPEAEVQQTAATQEQLIWLETATTLLEQNDGRMTAVMPRLYTSKEATILTFEGIGPADEIQNVLGALRAKRSIATFFITRSQIETEMDALTQIVQAGHQIGLLIGEDIVSVTDFMCSMLDAREKLRLLYGYQGELDLRPVGGIASSAFLEGACALGCPVISATFEATPETVWRLSEPETICETTLSEEMPSLQIGGIANFRMGVFTREGTLGNYVRYLLEEKSPYPAMSPGMILTDASLLYTWPLPENRIETSIRDAIAPGQTTYANVLQRITSGFIGMETHKKEEQLPGFTYLERDALNKRGTVPNENNQVFLTFHGWGSDMCIQEVLDVLEKHNAYATFFLQTDGVARNPNLARAIAAAGHDVGTMTHTGLPLAIGLDDDTHYVEINDTEADALRADLMTSYDTLLHIIGDMTNESGKPSLTRYFRPPDLAASRRGLEVAFDLGFTYCVFGSYDCGDDKAESVSDVLKDMRLNTKSGSVLILRISDDCPYTAEALDSYLTQVEENYYRFVELSKVLR